MNYTFHFPDLGEGLEEGTILEWYVKEGDRVKGGDPLVQMETDKVVADIPSPKSGTIVARYGKVGDVIQVGAPLVEIDPEGASSPAKEGGEPQRKVLATPVARALAKEMGVDIHEVQGSGPSGRVKKEDILQFSTGREPEPVRTTAEKSGSEDVTYLPLTQIRKTIARNMLHAKHHAAHMSVFEEVEISSLKAVIAKYKPLYAERGVKLTYLSFLVKAVAQALKHFPQLNSQIDEENNRMIVRHRQHIAIAVDAPEGLVVPVIRDGDQLSVFHIAQQIGELVSKARARTLTLQELKEGSFSITSFGSIGGIFATPVINYPQAGILGIGRIMKKPIVKGDVIVIGHIMPLSLTVDHRIVDGGEATRFLTKVMEYLADPVSLIMEEPISSREI